jgi:hypothetical protein
MIDCLGEYISNNLIELGTDKQYLLILPEYISGDDLKIFEKLAGKINMIIVQSDHFRLIEFKIGE